MKALTQAGVVRGSQLAAAGFGSRQISYQVKRGVLRRVHKSVYVLAGTDESWEQLITAAALAARPLGAASHRSAARLWGFRTVDSEIEVSIRYPRQLHLESVIVHRSVDLVSHDITWFDGIPVTTPERTLCDLGLVFPEPEVHRILRHQVATGRVNRHDVRALRRRIGRSGRNGAGVIGRCLDRLSNSTEATESGIEALFLEICEAYGLPEPAIQLPVVAAGRRYRLDFAYPAQRVFVEIDGVASHDQPRQIADDGFRQNNLVLAGWQPLRLVYHQMRNDPAACAAQIAAILGL